MIFAEYDTQLQKVYDAKPEEAVPLTDVLKQVRTAREQLEKSHGKHNLFAYLNSHRYYLEHATSLWECLLKRLS